MKGNYGALLVVAIVALVPFIVVTTSAALFERQVGEALGISATGLQVIGGLASAGYAFGALIAGDLTQRFRQRHLFLGCEAVFIAAGLMAAAAHGVALYACGRFLAGLTTGLLLIVALPTVVRQFPASRMPVTAAAVNIGFFGATTAGPIVGGVVATLHAWRGLYLVLALVGGLVWVLAYASLPNQPPQNPELKIDRAAFLLALAATMLPFWGAGQLTSRGFGSARFLIPLVAGLICLTALIVGEYHKQEPLAPVKLMWTTFPVAGALVAMLAGAAFVALLEFGERFSLDARHWTPWTTGWAWWPQVATLLAMSLLLSALIRTRWVPVLILAGMLLLAGGAALELGLEPTGGHLGWAAALLGLGAGATVGPGLWMAAFSLPSKLVGRAMALVELVRVETDFILAPVLIRFARNVSGGDKISPAGLHAAAAWMLAILLVGAGCIALLYLRGEGWRLPLPDLDAWLKNERGALESPPLSA